MEAFVLWHRAAPPPHDLDDWSATASWTSRVEERLEAVGAEIVGPIGGSLLAIFPAESLILAIDTGLALLEEAERADDLDHAPRVALGGELGELDVDASRPDSKRYRGGAIDRAQLLANRSRIGELTLGSLARDRASRTFLFSRVVQTGEPSLRGHVIDREEPRIERCRRNLAHLGRAPTPPSVARALGHLRELAERKGSTAVVLIGPPGNGSRRVIAELEFALRPSLSLHLQPLRDALEPLGSFCSALLRAFGEEASNLEDLPGLTRERCETLRQIAVGATVNRDAAHEALVELLTISRAEGGARPFIIVERLGAIDESSLDLVAKLTLDPRVDAFIVVHAPRETALPNAFERAKDLHELEVPALGEEEVVAMVSAMIREPEAGSIAKRIAASKERLPLAIVERLRTYVANGDVVRRGRAFVFRVGAQELGERSAVDVLRERISLLEPNAKRVLELIAYAPSGLMRDDFASLSKSFGLDAASFERALLRLRDDRFVVLEPLVDLDNSLGREAALASLSDSRRSVLANALATFLRAKKEKRRAALALYLRDIGALKEASELLLDAAEEAAKAGLSRSAIRLASTAVQTSATSANRERALAILRGETPKRAADAQTESTNQKERDAKEPKSPSAIAIAALNAREFEKIDRIIDLAIAEGASLSAGDRWRGLVAWLRGDLPAAEEAFLRSSARISSARRDGARTAIAHSLLSLRKGHAEDALRELLESLARARESKDLDAENALVHALGLCFNALGRTAKRAEAQATR